MEYTWTCRSCGQQHRGLPLDFACRAPDPWFGVPEAERAARTKLDSDLCMIDRQYWFVRGCLEIPILDLDDKFIWGVWVSVSKESFDRVLELWDAQNLAEEPPRFGWLCNNLLPYPTTFGLKTHLHMRAGTARPNIELEPTDHPLAIEQRQGITTRRVEELAELLLHRH